LLHQLSQEIDQSIPTVPPIINQSIDRKVH